MPLATPVPALALPLLMTKARTLLLRWFFATTTGAAQKTFWVNTAAVLVSGAKETIDKSNSSIFAFKFCARLMPALIAAQLTPLIFNNEFFIINP